MSTQNVLFDLPGPKARARHKLYNVFGVLLLAAVVGYVVLMLHRAGQFDPVLWKPMIQWSSWKNYFLSGLYYTILAAVISVTLAVVVGVVFGIGRLSENVAVRWLSGIFVEFFRAVPVLILMIAAYNILGRGGYVAPKDAPLFAVVIALTLYNGSVIAELVRSGVYGLPRGQREAGLAVGMTRSQSIRSIELPQAIIAMLPALVSQFVIILKDSALGYIVTYSELLRSARLLGTQNPLPILQSLFIAALIFIGVNYLLTRLAEYATRFVSGRTSGRTKPVGEAPGASVTAPPLGVPLDQEAPRDPKD